MNRVQSKFKAVLVIAAITIGSASARAGETIAYWQFEGSLATIGVDASGNGHDLADSLGTVQYSDTQFAPGTGSTGSVYFDGASILSSLSSLNLKPYEGQNLRLSFWVKNQTPQDANASGGLGTIFETGNSFKSYTGGLYAGVNGTYTDCSNCGQVGMMMTAAVNADQLPHNIYTGGEGVWEHYAIEFRPGAAAADVTKIYKNGVLMPDTVVNGGHATICPNLFRNEYMFLGMRKNTPTYSFAGKLDDVRIYDGASGELITEWLFEEGDNFLSDTSGNGHNLAMSGTYNGVSASSDIMDDCTGTSAAFNGSGQLATVSPLNLSAYNKLQIKFRVKNETTANAVGIFLEHSIGAYNVNGGFLLSSEELSGSGIGGIRLSSTARNYEAIHVDVGEWIDYEITFDQTVDNYEDVVVVKKNGVLQANDTPVENRRGVPASWVSPMPYPDQVVNVGARAGNTLNFIGYIDEMKLEAFPVPEPNFLALVCGGFLALLAGRRIYRG